MGHATRKKEQHLYEPWHSDHSGLEMLNIGKMLETNFYLLLKLESNFAIWEFDVFCSQLGKEEVNFTSKNFNFKNSLFQMGTSVIKRRNNFCK